MEIPKCQNYIKCSEFTFTKSVQPMRIEIIPVDQEVMRGNGGHMFYYRTFIINVYLNSICRETLFVLNIACKFALSHRFVVHNGPGTLSRLPPPGVFSEQQVRLDVMLRSGNQVLANVLRETSFLRFKVDSGTRKSGSLFIKHGQTFWGELHLDSSSCGTKLTRIYDLRLNFHRPRLLSLSSFGYLRVFFLCLWVLTAKLDS